MIDYELTNLKNEFPDFEKGWKDITKKLGFDFIDFIKDRINNEFSELRSFFDLQLSVVIDNNFIFGQIKNSIEKKKEITGTFIYKLAETEFVNIYAPYKLKDELYSKIETILNNNELAKIYADLLLQKIIIVDAFWINEWKKASNSIGHIDPDDIPYLALALHLKSHAIISKDKIFKKQGDSKSWNIQDTEQIIANYSSGLLSFLFIGGVAKITDLLIKTLIVFFKVIKDLVFYVSKILVNLTLETIDLFVDKVPGWISISVLALAVSSRKMRDGSKEFFKTAGYLINNISQELKELIKDIIKRIIDLMEALKPVSVLGIEMLIHIGRELGIMMEQIQKLESERAN